MKINALPAQLPEHIGLSVLGDRTRLTCIEDGEFVELDCSPEGFEQACASNPQPPWVRVAQDMLGGFMQLHRGCGEDTDADD